jgi:hypothetical protein
VPEDGQDSLRHAVPMPRPAAARATNASPQAAVGTRCCGGVLEAEVAYQRLRPFSYTDLSTVLHRVIHFLAPIHPRLL